MTAADDGLEASGEFTEARVAPRRSSWACLASGAIQCTAAGTLDRLHRALAQVIRTDEIGEWFQTPAPAFGGLKPLEVVERGETDRIWAMI